MDEIPQRQGVYNQQAGAKPAEQHSTSCREARGQCTITASLPSCRDRSHLAGFLLDSCWILAGFSQDSRWSIEGVLWHLTWATTTAAKRHTSEMSRGDSATSWKATHMHELGVAATVLLA